MKVTVRKQYIYPHNLNYYCSTFPPRSGFLAVQRSPETVYDLYPIAPAKTYEFIHPFKRDEDGWVATCKAHYVGPDSVMINDYVYTTYIKLI